MRRLLVFLACVGCVTGATPRHVVKELFSDGAASVYLTGNFARGFDVAYNAVLPQMRRNHGTSSVSIALLGRNPGSSISIGLSRASAAQSLESFVSSTTPQGAKYQARAPIACFPACGLVLRGDRYGIDAFVVTNDGIRKLGAWARSAFELARPDVALNAEVSVPGDRIAATLIPLRVVVDSRAIARPRCAFTARGIEPRRNVGGTLEFAGTYRPDATSSFIDLSTGKRVDRCTSE